MRTPHRAKMGDDGEPGKAAGTSVLLGRGANRDLRSRPGRMRARESAGRVRCRECRSRGAEWFRSCLPQRAVRAKGCRIYDASRGASMLPPRPPLAARGHAGITSAATGSFLCRHVTPGIGLPTWKAAPERSRASTGSGRSSRASDIFPADVQSRTEADGGGDRSRRISNSHTERLSLRGLRPWACRMSTSATSAPIRDQPRCLSEAVETLQETSHARACPRLFSWMILG